MYDTLVATDSDGTVIPGLASTWTVGPSSATFTLRDDVTCSDGEKLTAEVAAKSLRRFFDPATAAPFLTDVIGPENSADVSVEGQTVTVNLAKAYSGLLSGLSTPFTGIVCSAGTGDPTTLKTGSSGTGGYMAGDQVAGSSYTFVRRDNYNWGPSFAGLVSTGERPAELTMKVVSDENTRANLQSTDEVQIAGYTTDVWKRIAEQKGLTTAVSQQSDTYLMFNQTAGHPTADPAVRRAIAEAIDVQRLNQVQSYGAGEVMSDLGESTYACHDESMTSKLPRLDPRKAAETLGGLSLKVNGTTLLAGGDANSYVASALGSAGANVSFENLDNQRWAAGLFKPLNDWDVTILVYANTSSSLLSAANFFTGAVPPEGQNISAVSNDAASRALDAARQSSGTDGCKALSTYQGLLLDNVNVLPLATAPATIAYAPGVTSVVSKGFVRAATIRVAP
ncbi:ABC transporter substrate-binding protein [Rhodococcus ruber]|uniref:ABC transporter substrate-binding protein n=2 Tax=Rhodococcus ruber TaxID=1830 RepID=A0ABT4MMT2_9NOCA|nr:ABC transporter substrate-binding protein [Rhodococcus ruber]MCZ4522302.1 ABC transporter substrate-binding protein [Rhodococcus ruber]